MVNMSGSGPGYKHTVIITPYMHILIHHIPYMLRRHGSLRIFSGQGIYFLSFPIWVLWEPCKKIQHSHGELQNFVSIKLGPKKEYVPGLEIVTNTVANATNFFSSATKIVVESPLWRSEFCMIKKYMHNKALELKLRVSMLKWVLASGQGNTDNMRDLQ